MIPKKVTGQRSAKGSFKSALNYVLSDNQEGSKRPTIVAINMFGRSVSALAIEFLEVRSNSNRVKDPVWHVSLSAAHGEHFTDEEWGTIGMKLIDTVGAKAKKNEVGISTQNNQFVIVRHHNEDYEHIHIILNRVNLDLKTCYCSWDKNDLHAAAAEIEIEYGLTRCDHGKAKRSGYQKKDRRDLSPRVVARLEKKEQKTGETDPKLTAYREMISQQLQQIEQQQLLEQLEQTKAEGRGQRAEGIYPDASGVARQSPGTSGLSTEIKPNPATSTSPQQQQEPTSRPPVSSEENLQRAEHIKLIARLIFQQAKVLGKAKKIGEGIWSYQDKEYAFVYNEQSERLAVTHHSRGPLVRYESGKPKLLGTIETEDLEAFAKYSESRKETSSSQAPLTQPQRKETQIERE